MAIDDTSPSIAVLGASGLIGHAIATELMRAGYPTIAVARRFTAAQRNTFAESAFECPFASFDVPRLAQLFSAGDVDVVVNCVGILQDERSERADNVHRGFVVRLAEALGSQPKPCLLVHLSVPGRDEEDATEFSRTKRDGERVIAASTVPFVILRPGFVIAPAAYGGSAMIRALAAMPFVLPEKDSVRAFAVADIADITNTVAYVAERWHRNERCWKVTWEVMSRHPSTLGDVVEGFRMRLGKSRPRMCLPSWLMHIGAWGGDLSAHLGWRPSIRSTALLEMRRGVTGDPGPWIAATGIEPTSLECLLGRMPATVQEKWFARLYVTKALIIVSLAIFWVASGLIALTMSFAAAIAVLNEHGISLWIAQTFTVISCFADISIGTAIAVRKTCRVGLIAGIALSLCYLVSATLVAPGLWVDPLGSLLKIVPAVVLMLVALAILEDR